MSGTIERQDGGMRGWLRLAAGKQQNFGPSCSARRSGTTGAIVCIPVRGPFQTSSRNFQHREISAQPDWFATKSDVQRDSLASLAPLHN